MRLKRPSRIHRGFLAEPYDGIGQYVRVALSRSSTSAARLVRVAAGDFGGGRRFPAGTPVTVFSINGRLEVGLGNIARCITDHFRRPATTVETGDRTWGTGPLGTWLKVSQMTDQDPAFDEAAWLDGEYGLLTYTGLDDPTQGLRIATPASPETADPAGLPATIYWPLNFEHLVTWQPGAANAYLQLYMGPAYHGELNAWVGITTQWYGAPELYGMEIDVGSQGWADWPTAPDAMFGNIWFHEAVAPDVATIIAAGGLRLKVRADNTGVFAKSWINGTPEPASWLLKVYWNPAEPMYSRVREFFRILFYEVQVGGETLKMNWVKICKD